MALVKVGAAKTERFYLMDAQLQQAIRDFDPHDVGSQALWHRLARVTPLQDVVETVPLKDLSLKYLLRLSGKILAEIGTRIKKVPAPNLSNPVHHNHSAYTSLTVTALNADPGQLFSRVGTFLSECATALTDGYTPHITTGIESSVRTFSDGDFDTQAVTLQMNVTNIRPETAEETASRVAHEKAFKQEEKKQKRDQAKVREDQERAYYEKLKKKFEKKDKKKAAKNDAVG